MTTKPQATTSRSEEVRRKHKEYPASVLEAYLRPEHILRNYQAGLPGEIRRHKEFSARDLSLQAQSVALSDLLQFFYGDYGIPMILAGQIAQQRIRNLFKQEAGQVQDHLINLGISLPGNKTTEMGELMYHLASSDEIQRHDSADLFLDALGLRGVSPRSLRAAGSISWTSLGCVVPARSTRLRRAPGNSQPGSSSSSRTCPW